MHAPDMQEEAQDKENAAELEEYSAETIYGPMVAKCIISDVTRKF